MNVFRREMKAQRLSLILWCVGMFFMIAAGLGKYSYYYESGQSINALMAEMPKVLRAVLGIGNFDLTTASGFYALLYVYLLVMATIQSAMMGANIIAKEERDHTAEFLFSKPASRTRIVTEKLAAAVLNVVILNGVTTVLSIVLVGKYSHGEDVTMDILLMMMGMLFLQLLFLFLGSFLASCLNHAAGAASLAGGILMLTYLLSVVTDMSQPLGNLKVLTPFKYFDPAQLLHDGAPDPLFVALAGVLIVLLAGGTYRFYLKRDLKV